ncbi:hypothetical protein [Haloarcula sp. JP-L23]|uniref:hypothetical protein n=1 Tax=Haloarcula sp. JP-L23 TaxID=2716717 RepID=UPI00140F4AB6|nr:hypothetical protein G9465_19905 [Haloarcula sp. JP-L23]
MAPGDGIRRRHLAGIDGFEERADTLERLGDTPGIHDDTGDDAVAHDRKGTPVETFDRFPATIPDRGIADGRPVTDGGDAWPER